MFGYKKNYVLGQCFLNIDTLYYAAFSRVFYAKRVLMNVCERMNKNSFSGENMT